MNDLSGATSRSLSSNVRHYFASSRYNTKSDDTLSDGQNQPPRDSFHDELDEHTNLVDALSHETLTSQIRKQQPRINWFDASMHLIKGNLGPGCLNLPRAFTLSGWLLGTFMLILVVLQGIYSMILLVELKQILLDANYRSQTFIDVANVSLGSKGRTFVQFFLFVLQTGVCCVFLDLIATNLETRTGLSTHASIAWVTAALLLVVLVRYLKDLRLLSTTANVFMITAVITAAVVAVIAIEADGTALPPKATFDFGDTVTFISSMFFSFEGIGLVLPIENAFTVASTPDDVRKANIAFRTWVLPGAMITVGALFWITGFFTSWAFPNIRNSSVTAYLYEEFPDNPWFKSVNTMVMLAVFLTFPLQLAPAMEVLEQWCQPSPSSALAACSDTQDQACPPEDPRGNDEPTSGAYHCWKKITWIIPRYGIVLGCAIVVYLVHDLGLLMALFGAVGQTGLAMTPCLCHLALQRKGKVPKQGLKTFMNLITVTFCSLVMLFGLVTAVNRIATRVK